MKSLGRAAWLATVAWLFWLSSARAEPRVSIVETHPAGDSIVLGTHQNLYVRLSYTTDQPVRIWVRPYFRGREVDAGSNPSQPHSGTGEALGWFFLTREGDEVDELRVTAGDGSHARTHLVASHAIRVVAAARPAAQSTPPPWVTSLTREAELASKAEAAQAASAPVSPGETAVLGGFMLAVLVLPVLGFAAPVWFARRWRGGWRIAAAAPAAMMAFVVLRIVVDVSMDPTSHNLWPFELLMFGLLSGVITALLVAARRFAPGAA